MCLKLGVGFGVRVSVKVSLGVCVPVGKCLNASADSRDVCRVDCGGECEFEGRERCECCCM